jgi:hypothetical protein
VQQKTSDQQKICMKIELNEIYNQNQKVINENNAFKAIVRSYDAEVNDVNKI